MSLGTLIRRGLSTAHKVISPMDFKPQKALVLTKVSRYEFERHNFPDLTETEFESVLTNRGSDYTMIKYHHNIHKDAEEKVVRALESRGVETKKVQRKEFSSELIDWADVVFTTGGDGTFLLGASKIRSPDKPIIGINTDPTRSEGYLLLPKHFSFNIDNAINLLLKGHFRWFFRRRLRITLLGDAQQINEPAIELHKQQLQYPEYRYMDFLQEKSVSPIDHPLRIQDQSDNPPISQRVLPVLALNEVFLGESLSSRVSYLEIVFDNDPPVKSRNSGLCISTGTGSTSWTYNINKLTHQSVEAILRIVSEATRYPINFKDAKLVENVTKRFNNELVFDPQLNMMTYTLRDPVGLLGGPASRKPRGNAKRIEVRSKCFDACLVVDGSLSYKFNDGTRAILELKDEDALRTVQLFASEPEMIPPDKHG